MDRISRGYSLRFILSTDSEHYSSMVWFHPKINFCQIQNGDPILEFQDLTGDRIILIRSKRSHFIRKRDRSNSTINQKHSYHVSTNSAIADSKDQVFLRVVSQTKGLLVNADGCVDIYFGPKPPAGKENNWVQTISTTDWNTILRLYGPLEPWFDKTWRTGKIELLKYPYPEYFLIV